MRKNQIVLLSVRILLVCLILTNLVLIFRFSLQNATESESTSGRVSDAVASVVVEDYHEKNETERLDIRNRIDPTVRKLAHMAEFGSLGALVFVLLLTWRWRLPFQYLTALGTTLAVACIDELIQNFSEGRAMQLTDLLTDLLGGIAFCSLILAFVCTFATENLGIT